MNAIARIAAIAAVLITTPTWAQTLRIGGVDIRVVSDAHVIKADSTDAPVLGKVGTYAIVRGASVPAAKGLAASDAQTDHLGVAFNPGTGRYGLISRELTFRLKPGSSLPSEYADMGCKALIEKIKLFVCNMDSVNQLISTETALRARPDVEWVEMHVITDRQVPQ
ncbi:MAG: hypothetical protein EBR18_08875 [Betaproteobacteria bacterium]|nr:hypothetical protein [Betaproteobacteria bacterium]